VFGFHLGSPPMTPSVRCGVEKESLSEARRWRRSLPLHGKMNMVDRRVAKNKLNLNYSSLELLS
jgi:hypothetical protein